jgi:hypothetical protein
VLNTTASASSSARVLTENAEHPRPWSLSYSPRTLYPYAVLDCAGRVLFTMSWGTVTTPMLAAELAQGWIDAYNAAELA